MESQPSYFELIFSHELAGEVSSASGPHNRAIIASGETWMSYGDIPTGPCTPRPILCGRDVLSSRSKPIKASLVQLRGSLIYQKSDQPKIKYLGIT